MAQFAALGADGADGILKTVGDLAGSVNKALEANLTGNRILELKFPDKVILPTNVGDKAMRYNFAWKVVATHQFTSAYYTHTRATLHSSKDHDKEGQKAKEKALTGSSKAFTASESEVRKNVVEVLAKKYTEKYEKAKVACTKTSSAPLGGGLDYTAWAKFHQAYKTKYGFTMPEREAADAPAAAGRKIAEAIIKKKHKDFEEKYKSAKGVARTERVEALIAAKHPGLSKTELENKVAKAIAKEVSSSKSMSCGVAYQVTYKTIMIDERDVADRWRRLREKFRHERDEEVQDAEKSQYALQKRLDKAMKDTTNPNLQRDVDRIRKRIGEWDEKIDKANARYEKRKEQIRTEEAEVATMVTGNEAKKLIGPFEIHPIGSCGGVETGIRYRNTNAWMTVAAQAKSDGSVVVSFDWKEESKTELPKTKLFSNTYTTYGTVTFKPDGTYEYDNKIGARFNELCQKA